MKYVIVKIGQTEVPVMFGNEVDLNQVSFPWPIVAAGQAIGHTVFYSCQSTQTINDQIFVSRGRKDEVLIQAADYLTPEQPVTGE